MIGWRPFWPFGGRTTSSMHLRRERPAVASASSWPKVLTEQNSKYTACEPVSWQSDRQQSWVGRYRRAFSHHSEWHRSKRIYTSTLSSINGVGAASGLIYPRPSNQVLE